MIDLDAFAALAKAELDALPRGVHALTGDVMIAVADEAPAEVLAELGLSRPDELLGLFEGVGLGQDGATLPTGAMPNRIWLYRRPILAFTAEGEDPLPAVVRHVLVHEIGHHFGLSDEDMYAIDDEASPVDGADSNRSDGSI